MGESHAQEQLGSFVSWALLMVGLRVAATTHATLQQGRQGCCRQLVCALNCRWRPTAFRAYGSQSRACPLLTSASAAKPTSLPGQRIALVDHKLLVRFRTCSTPSVRLRPPFREYRHASGLRISPSMPIREDLVASAVSAPRFL